MEASLISFIQLDGFQKFFNQYSSIYIPDGRATVLFSKLTKLLLLQKSWRLKYLVDVLFATGDHLVGNFYK
jgi:hypothetical protein